MPKKKCRACHEWIHAEDIYVAALEHWIDRHPHDDRLSDVLTDQWVEADCRDCDQPFFSPVSYGAGTIGAEAYCPDCDDVGFRQVMAQTLTPADLVAREADPAADDLGDRAPCVCDGGGVADGSRAVFRDDFMLVRDHVERNPNDERVAVQVGRPVEDARPTILNARELRDALDEYLQEDSDDQPD